jgi:hypothetical protein
MNAIAAGPGWRNLAIWALPPIAYALASDTLARIWLSAPPSTERTRWSRDGFSPDVLATTAP